MIKRLLLLLVGLGVLVAACEPLAPDVTQEIVIVTGEPTLTPLAANPIPPSPTRIPPTATLMLTPTSAIIPTATVPPCDKTTGTLFETTFQSTITQAPIPYNIYLPPCFFESGRRYPYVVLLHGSGYTLSQWVDLGVQAAMDTGIAARTLAPMVLVMPEGGSTQENNFFDIGVSFEDVVLNELLPELERTYCVQLEAKGRAIGGISRGGFWAFSIALRHPEIFSAIGGHSPAFLPDNAPITHNPLALAERANPIPGLRIYLDNAQSDNGGANVLVFSNNLRARGIEHTYIINPRGGHDNAYWSEHVGEYLTFYSQAFPFSAAEMPSCQ